MNRSFSWKPWGLAAALGAIVMLGGGWVALQNRVQGEENSQAQSAVKTHKDVEAISHANSISYAFRQAAAAARPSVVKILAHTGAKHMKNTSSETPFNGENPFKGTPFEKMFPGGQGQFNFPQQQQPERDGLGSGVIIDKSGIVLTNNHVVRGADEVTVVLKDGREFKATDIKTDPASDLAVLRLEGAKDLPAATLGNSDEMEVGDWVLAIGCPFGLEQTVSAGIISGKGRELESNHDEFLQTDAAINPGNSGGPLVNLDGQVIGINTAIATNSGGYQGIGFSIPINTAKWVVKQLLAGGKVQRAYLGVQLEELNADLAKKFGASADQGVLVADVVKDSPAAAAGLQDGDVIVDYQSKAVHNPRELRDLVEVTPVGSKQTLAILRNGKTMNVSITPKALPAKFAENNSSQESQGDTESATDTYQVKEFGLTVGDMTSDEAKAFDGHHGVVVRQVEPDGVAAHKRLEPGMLIRKVGEKPVKNVQDFEAAMKHESPKAGVMFQVRVGNNNMFVVLQAK
ncbi:MAG TPA: Do family serine endopeptidase [Pirellulales bacterium]|nr:Do family serine endopeptidase [Pirellulales bacterium]